MVIMMVMFTLMSTVRSDSDCVVVYISRDVLSMLSCVLFVGVVHDAMLVMFLVLMMLELTLTLTLMSMMRCDVECDVVDVTRVIDVDVVMCVVRFCACCHVGDDCWC